jgi:glycosyltransferase involved in cell wall biosynthesis
MLSLVIPCYNETDVLELTYHTLVDEAPHWHEAIEILFVDDGSHDDTWSIIERLTQRDERIVGLRLSRNFGHQAAIGAGLEQARGEAVIVLDADLQDPPRVVRAMLEQWRAGCQVVAAQRLRRRGESWFKKTVGYLFYRLLGQVTDVAIPADVGDFALLDRQVVDALLSFREHGMFWRGLRCYTGFRHACVFFERPGRAAGQTKYTLRKLMGLASNGLLAFSDLPLRLPLYLGLLTLAATLAIGLVGFAWSWATNSALPVSLLELGLFFLGAVQLLSLGVIGEYLNRIYAEVRNRPRWIIAAQVGQKEAGANHETPARPSMATPAAA